MSSFRYAFVVFCVLVVLFTIPGTVSAQTENAPTSEPTITFNWEIVVNNGVIVPLDAKARVFNSYNQPSINVNQFVVFRGRSKAGKNADGTPGEPAHGVWVRDMKSGAPLTTLFDRTTLVPQPNNLGTMFIEPPSFPRIDMFSNTIASRANHPPLWNYLLSDGITESRAGTTGIYTNAFGNLIAGASNVGGAEGLNDFKFFTEPTTGVKFDVFPGAPAVANSSTIVFKGNFTIADPSDPAKTISKTGVYFRNLRNAGMPLLDGGATLEPAGGTRPAVLIANTDTRIPGTTTKFGSTAPPSAVGLFAVFAGFDNEDSPTKGGIYLAPMLWSKPPLIPLVKIGGQVPEEAAGVVFNKLGEGVSYDGRFVAFWGAWGFETKALTLICGNEGNKDRVAFCKAQYPNGFATTVPVHQGVFVHDTLLGSTKVVAKAPQDFDDFIYWNFSGLVPGTGESDDTGEPARWRSATFVAVSGLVDGILLDKNFHVAFKARKGDVVDGAYVNTVDGIYLRKGPNASAIVTVVKTGMDGTQIDPGAVYDDDENPDTPPVMLPVTEMGLERDGFRGNSLAINVSMGTEEAGWAGIYLTRVPQ